MPTEVKVVPVAVIYASIRLAYRPDKRQDEWGNQFMLRGSIGRCNQSKSFDRTTYDVLFALEDPGSGKCSAKKNRHLKLS